MTPEAAFCVACGAGLGTGDRFCRGCGRELSPAELAKTGASPPPAAATPPPSPLAPPAVSVPTIKWPAPSPVDVKPMPSDRPAAAASGGMGSGLRRGLRAVGRGAAGCLTILVALGILGFALDFIGRDGADAPGAISTPRPTARATVRFTPMPEPSPRVVTLAQATADGLVEMLAEGRSLQVLDLTLTSLADEPLAVVVPAGLLFDAKASGTQSMVVTVQETIELTPGEKQSRPLDVACAAMDLDQPGDTDRFTLATASAKLRQLVASPGFPDADFRVQQFAIWTITDNPTRSSFVGIGLVVGTGPDDDEIDQIRALFKAAGLDPSDYRALR